MCATVCAPATPFSPRPPPAGCCSPAQTRAPQELLLRGAFWLPLHVEAESGDATWLLYPRVPGKYPYVCTVKGHQNMKGVLEII